MSHGLYAVLLGPMAQAVYSSLDVTLTNACCSIAAGTGRAA
jgi:hypothetical protein